MSRLRGCCAEYTPLKQGGPWVLGRPLALAEVYVQSTCNVTGRQGIPWSIAPSTTPVVGTHLASEPTHGAVG